MEVSVGKRIKLDPRVDARAAQMRPPMTTTSTNELGRKPKAAPAATVMDTDGDLLLRVGAELPGVQTTDFRVCSAAMRRASPVWKSMLFGPWSEAKPRRGNWVVNLPEDNPAPLLVILTIIHGTFSDVPRGMWIPQLYDVLVVLDKYNLMGIIQPWYRYWEGIASNPPKRSATAAASQCPGEYAIMRIHAGWELGVEDAVVRGTTYLIFMLGYKKTSFWYEDREVTFGSHSGPPGIEDIIKTLRLSYIQSLLDFYHNQIDSRLKGKVACTHTGLSRAYAKESWVCDTVILGSMLRNSRHGKLPSILPRTAADYSYSVSALLCALGGFFNGKSLRTLPHHSGCSPAKDFGILRSKMRQVLEGKYTNILPPHYKEHMAAQQKKLKDGK